METSHIYTCPVAWVNVLDSVVARLLAPMPSLYSHPPGGGGALLCHICKKWFYLHIFVVQPRTLLEQRFQDDAQQLSPLLEDLVLSIACYVPLEVGKGGAHSIFSTGRLNFRSI